MSERIDAEIQAEEDRLTQATRTLDVDALDRIYADDIIFTGVTGQICDKASVMAEARRGTAERQSPAPGAATVVAYDKDDLRIVRHGEAAAASYRFGVTIRHDGADTVRRYRTTNVWMKRQGRWQVVAAQTAALTLS